MGCDQPATATGVLPYEPKLLLDVAHSLRTSLTAERDGGPLDFEAMERYISFFRLFADACHHGKEEDLLFPGLEDQGMSHDSGPIAVMLLEHEQGRGLVRTMSASLESARRGNGPAGDALRDAAEGYVELIVAHIAKENGVLFNMADGMIVGPDCRDLCAGYDEVCGRRFEGQTKEDLERLAAAILER